MNGVAKCLAHIERTGVDNVRLFADDARLVMAALLPGAVVVGRAFVLFPRSLARADAPPQAAASWQRDTLDILARLLKPGAELRLATDDPKLPALDGRACLHRIRRSNGSPSGRADWRTRPADWPSTRYEQKRIAGPQPDIPAAEVKR